MGNAIKISATSMPLNPKFLLIDFNVIYKLTPPKSYFFYAYNKKHYNLL